LESSSFILSAGPLPSRARAPNNPVYPGPALSLSKRIVKDYSLQSCNQDQLDGTTGQLTRKQSLALVAKAKTLANTRKLERQFAAKSVPAEKPPLPPLNARLPRKQYLEHRHARGDELKTNPTAGDEEPTGQSEGTAGDDQTAERPRPARLWFDADVARKCHGDIRAAIWVKNVELRVSSKLKKIGTCEASVAVWESRGKIAAMLGFTVPELRTAQENARNLVTLKKEHDNHTNHTLFARLVHQNAFLKSRQAVTPWSVQVDEIQAHGECAAVFLQMLRVFIREAITVGKQPDDEGYWWHYDSMADLLNLYQGIFSRQQLKRAITHLVADEMILRRPYNPKDERDPRRAYALCKQFQPEVLASCDLQKSAGSKIANREIKNRKSLDQGSQIHSTETPLPRSEPQLAEARTGSDQPHTEDTPETSPSGRFLRLSAEGRFRSTGDNEGGHANPKAKVSNQVGDEDGDERKTCQDAGGEVLKASGMNGDLGQRTEDEGDEVAEFMASVDLSQDVEIVPDFGRVERASPKPVLKEEDSIIRPKGSPVCFGTGSNIPTPTSLCGSCVWKESCSAATPLEVKVKRSLDSIRWDGQEKHEERLTRKSIMEAYRSAHLQMQGRLPVNPIGSIKTIIQQVQRLKCDLRTYFFLSLVSYRDNHFFDQPVWDGWFGSRAETNSINAYERVLRFKYGCVHDLYLGLFLGLPKDDHGNFDWSQFRTAHDLPWEAWKERHPQYQASEADLEAVLKYCRFDTQSGVYAAEVIREMGSQGLLPLGLKFADLFGDHTETLLKVRRLRSKTAEGGKSGVGDTDFVSTSGS